MTNLIWFRADLRTADNTALYAACAKPADPVLAVFLLSPAQWLDHDWAPVKVDLILRTLRELSDSLAARNIPLLIRRFIPELAHLDNKSIHEPWTLPPLALANLNYPHHPIAGHAKSRARVIESFRAISE
ncbi:MAG: deoxyribodipyrimidine photo-lyase [Phycisphaerales bacterium]|nr:deoxyribodipyrimidine photo-lyase [Phycisphaerales bacterium]